MSTPPFRATAPAPTPLPPYTGDDATCAKCAFPEARTRYRKAGSYRDDEMTLFGPSPRPERLERECLRCDYVWDEALNPPDAPEPIGRELTITELADALSASHQGWALDLSPELAAHMAVGLLRTLDVRTRPDATGGAS
ncbi:hypothetical protein ACH4Q7_22500 [Streptomyces roseolus]|uniref:hypothetical protein n=1 Tax=Streptomyces roseolus TaxID=67358 RepID=UPI0037A33F0C